MSYSQDNEEKNMKIAIVGSRNLKINNPEKYLPCDADEIISGGARGIDTCARDFAIKNGIKLTEILPDYEKYGRAAPIKRNDLIIDSADIVLAFWDGKSKGTKYVIETCRRKNKRIKIFMPVR